MSDRTPWYTRFSHQDPVQFRDESGGVVELGEVYTAGTEFLQFYVKQDSALLDRLTLSDRVTVRSLRYNHEVTGRLSVVDHQPKLGTGSASEGRLLRFEPTESPSPTPIRGSLKAWRGVLHLGSLPATIIPILLGILYALWMQWGVQWSLAMMGLAGGALLHLASNLHNEFSDYHFGIRRGDSLNENLINTTNLNPGVVWSVALLMYSLAIVPGIPLLWIRGPSLAVVGLLSFLASSYYSLDYFQGRLTPVIRNVTMTVLMGPLLAVASSLAASGRWDLPLVAVAVPVGLFVNLLLHEEDLNNLPLDRRAGATTLALVLGFEGSKLYYLSLTFAGYLVIGFMVATNLAPVASLLSFLSLPLAVRNIRLLKDIESPINPKFKELRYNTVMLQAVFGGLYLVGFLSAVYL